MRLTFLLYSCWLFAPRSLKLPQIARLGFNYRHSMHYCTDVQQHCAYVTSLCLWSPKHQVRSGRSEHWRMYQYNNRYIPFGEKSCNYFFSGLLVTLSSQACKDSKTNSRFFGTKHSIDWKFVVSSICMVHTALLEWTWTKKMGLQQSVSTSSLCVPLLQVREDFLCGSCWTQKPLLLREDHRGDFLWGPMVLRQTAAWYSIQKKKS